MKDQKREFSLQQKIYTGIVAVGMIALAFSLVNYYMKTRKIAMDTNNTIVREQTDAVDVPVTKERQEATTTEATKATEQTTEKTKETAANLQEYDGKTKIAWPLTGNVILPYSMDATVYYETLDQYQCNPGMLIQAQVGSKVKSVYAGTVLSVDKSNKLGQTVMMDLGNGYYVSYAQLSNVSVKKGDQLKKGDLIGKIAEPTRFFTLEGSHLYFEMTKDGKAINPADYLE